MLKFNDGKFISINKSSLVDEEIYERYNLQQAIVDCWDQFKNEIGMPDILFIGQEVVPHSSVDNRIDILAFHPYDNLPIVIELKRGKDKLQLLQSITYASMISTWSSDDLLRIAEESESQDIDDLRLSLADFDNDHVRIVLVAERYDPEVILSADWLYRTYQVDIVACSITVYVNQNDTYITFSKKYPLAELKDSYVERSRKQNKKSTNSAETSWDDVKQKISYAWGNELIELCRNIMPGDPSRQRFVHIFKNFEGLKGLSVFIRHKYVNIYILGKPEKGAEFFQAKFRDEIQIGEWKNGWSLHVKT